MTQQSLYLAHPEKIIIQNDTCTQRFTEALFPIARLWKQPKCSSAEEWMKMWYLWYMMKMKFMWYNGMLLSHTTEYNWVICSDADRPRVCYTVMQSEESQKEKNK